jgi:hypothetical protein
MSKIICGLLPVVLITLFFGGLAQSIWEGTGSIAFPIIIVFVLIMVYVDTWQSIKKGN